MPMHAASHLHALYIAAQRFVQQECCGHSAHSYHVVCHFARQVWLSRGLLAVGCSSRQGNA